eukprot:NODE_537_length_1386_cov_79.791104_g502_i0.p1 GENE.NODE_537_length_1386_cov_79.791104_g502_i0~~NODE_537_length_1386_cov_79.791104_g502_i0.p1  ORF type:complete len:337 (-),score=48.38 NODE_537_length_1386_cov_79.791104_g502_i0:376-1299(-)
MPDQSSDRMQLGAAINLFDGEELLRACCVALRPHVDYLCVIFQRVSNFGAKCTKAATRTLEELQKEGIIDEVVMYDPVQTISAADKRKTVSVYASMNDIGGSVGAVAEQFINETMKREKGRLACLRHGCNYFMLLDVDEFYQPEELEKLKDFMWKNPMYDGCVAKIRYFYKYPTVELLPLDPQNMVPVMYKCDERKKFQLAHPYPVLIDPTRCVAGVTRLKVMEPEELCMYHYSFVRSKSGVLAKLQNVSNKANYHLDPEEFMRRFDSWDPATASTPILPHPYFAKLYTKFQEVPNWFNIPDVWNPT